MNEWEEALQICVHILRPFCRLIKEPGLPPTTYSLIFLPIWSVINKSGSPHEVVGAVFKTQTIV